MSFARKSFIVFSLSLLFFFISIVLTSLVDFASISSRSRSDNDDMTSTSHSLSLSLIILLILSGRIDVIFKFKVREIEYDSSIYLNLCFLLERIIDYENNQSYAIYDQSFLKLEMRDYMSEFDDYLTIYLEVFNEMCEILKIDNENVVVVNNNDVSCEVIIEKLTEILE